MSAKVSDRDIYLRAKHGVDMTSYQRSRLAELIVELYNGTNDIDTMERADCLERFEAIIHGPKLVDRPVRRDCNDCTVE